MNQLEKAATYDAEDRPQEAADAYEAAIASGDANLETYLNLAVLYFQSNDGSYAAHHGLPVAFLNQAWNRIDPLLDEATKRIGTSSEVAFWRQYWKFILIGSDHRLDRRTCDDLLKHGDPLVPAFYLFSSFAGLSIDEAEEYRPLAQQLFDAVREGRTPRERYIRSVLEATFRNRRATK